MENMKLLDVPKTEISRRGAGMFLAGFLVGFATYWLLFDVITLNAPTSPNELGEKTTGAVDVEGGAKSDTPISATATSEDTALVVSNQPAGGSAMLSMAVLAQSGWVAIHEVLSDETHGNILGARRFDAGRYFGEEIELLRNTEEGRRYTAVLHADDGDSTFDHKKEVPVKDALGSFISSEFTATVGLSG